MKYYGTCNGFSSFDIDYKKVLDFLESQKNNAAIKPLIDDIFGQLEKTIPYRTLCGERRAELAVNFLEDYMSRFELFEYDKAFDYEHNDPEDDYSDWDRYYISKPMIFIAALISCLENVNVLVGCIMDGPALFGFLIDPYSGLFDDCWLNFKQKNAKELTEDEQFAILKKYIFLFSRDKILKDVRYSNDEKLKDIIQFQDTESYLDN